MGRKIRDIMTGVPVTVGPQMTVAEVARRMRDEDIGAVLVAEGGRPVGIVSLGDLAIERDPGSALGQISSAEPNQ